MKKRTLVAILIGIAAFIGGIVAAANYYEKKKWEGLDDGWDDCFEDWEDEVADEDIEKEFDEER